MKKKVLIISGILLLIIGIYLLFQKSLKNTPVSSNMLKKLESEWNSSEKIGRINK
jgi:hypothetical protein